jgi:predicted ATPase/DNA-binding CsgD family transcriptional regulator/Tfp pilus assembly protein PilF
MSADIPPLAGNLPVEPNSFIGRERDLAELKAMLGRVRALTLCGPGGIGKTRLALRLATALAPDFPDGAWIAELADAETSVGSDAVAPDGADSGDPAARLVSVVTAALGIRHEPGRPLAATLSEALRDRAMLLILDTCDHLVQACAELVQRLLAGCPGVRVIATSREPLRVRGEVIWRVPPLGLAQPGHEDNATGGEADLEAVASCEAVRLFVERAAAVRPGFTLDEANVTAVAQVCSTLDGVPLAIELAAARVRALSVDQISGRLADRFEFLALGDRTAPVRQQTLRAAVAWSYELLTPPERLLLSRLSVFNGWGLEMAERVCSDEAIPASEVLDLLTALIDKSLVSLDGELSGNARYRLLDTVRELAAEHAVAAGEMTRLRTAHRDCTLDLAEKIAAAAFVRGAPSWPERVTMYLRVRADRANINLALAWCVQRSNAEEGLRICHALAGSFLASGEVAEGAGWIDRLLAIDAVVSPGVRARALAIRAMLAFEQQDYSGSEQFAATCLELSRICSDGNPSAALRQLAMIDLVQGKPESALATADEAIEAARTMADEWEEGLALEARAAVIASQGQLDNAEQEYRHALGVLRDNNGWGLAHVLYGLGQVARGRGDLDGAARYFADALARYRQIDARPEMARCLAGIGLIALTQGDLAAARTALTESMRLSLATGHRLAIARGLQALATLALADGAAGQAALLCGAAIPVFEAIGLPASAGALRRLDAMLEAAEAAIGPAAVAALRNRGREMSPHQAATMTAAADAAPGTATRPGTCSPAGNGTGAPNGHAPGGRSNGSHGPVAGLSERQLQVARLVALGRSNREIGRELFIAESTAARHIANIFKALGFNSRAQIVAWLAGRENGDS